MGTSPAAARTDARAFATPALQLSDGLAAVTGLTRSRVASRRASSSPKNSVTATATPVKAAQARKMEAGQPIQRCQRRQNATSICEKREAGSGKREAGPARNLQPIARSLRWDIRRFEPRTPCDR